MTEIRNNDLGEVYYEIKHRTGLTILVYPKAGYSTTYAVFGTNYGSIDTFIKTEKEQKQIPEGTAHYLEHKLFESEELDAFQLFARTGASANAYTSFDKTCYLFSCSSNFSENLKYLLDFVQKPYFTEETVRKEQGIIGQEIQMYKDEPGWQVLFNLLKCLYHDHPVRIDIAGTIESISHITADLLYDCYNSFYNPSNMVLAVAGNTTVDEVLAVADEALLPKECFEVSRAQLDEPDETVSNYIAEEFAVTIPTFAFGYKEHCDRPLCTLKEKILADIILEYIAGETSPLYNRLLCEGLVSAGFGGEYFAGYGYRAVIFDGQSSDPDRVAEEIKKEIAGIRENGFNENELDRIRKMNYGRCVMGYNNIDGLANELVSSHFENYHLFDELDIYRSITVEDVVRRFEGMFVDGREALSVILPFNVDEV